MSTPTAEYGQLHTDAMRRWPEVKDIVARVLLHNSRWRIVVLETVDASGKRTPVTYAVTRLARDWSPQVRAVNEILRHQTSETARPMGALFRDQGLVVRQNQRLRLRRLPAVGALRTLLQARRVDVEAYEFFAGDTLYGRVLELRRPKGSWPARPRLGSYQLTRGLGLSHARFMSWLVGEQPSLRHRPVIWLSQWAGVCSDGVLLAWALVYARRLLH